MSEWDVISQTPEPRTRETLARDLITLGLAPGDVVVVHSSLRSLGWVSGGAVAVVVALMDVLTEDGTLVMPTQSAQLSDPSGWGAPPVPEAWHETIRQTTPAYDPRITPTRGMGAVVEVFRAWPEVARSAHPLHSLAAWGKHSGRVTEGHTLDYSLGEGSPLARVYELDGKVLLLGAGHDSNTSLHLAEYRAPGARETTESAPVFENGRRVWKTFRDIDLDEEVFEELGRDFDESEGIEPGKVGSAGSRLFSQRRAVDFAGAWISKRRGLPEPR